MTNLWHTFRQWCRDVNWPEVITAAMTVVLATIGYLQLQVYRQQKKIMESSGAQTDQLIRAANIQADAATKNAEAATSFAITARSVNAEISSAVGQLTTQAQKMTNLSALAGQVAGPRVNLSDWMGLYHSTKTRRVWARVRVQNDGQSDALAVFIAASTEFLGSPPSQSRYNFTRSDFKPVSPPRLMPFSKGPPSNPSTPWICQSCGELAEHVSEEISPDKYPVYKLRTLYIWGKIRYKNVNGDEVLGQFCRSASGREIFEATEEGGANPGPTDCK